MQWACIMSPSSKSVLFERASRVLLPNKNVNEQWDIANGGVVLKACLDVSAGGSGPGDLWLGLAGLCKRHLGQNGWAGYSHHLGDCPPFPHPFPSFFLKFFFFYIDAAAKMSPQCAMWYVVNFTCKKSVSLRPYGCYHSFITSVASASSHRQNVFD